MRTVHDIGTAWSGLLPYAQPLKAFPQAGGDVYRPLIARTSRSREFVVGKTSGQRARGGIDDYQGATTAMAGVMLSRWNKK
jgi:hypothetical protein